MSDVKLTAEQWEQLAVAEKAAAKWRKSRVKAFACMVENFNARWTAKLKPTLGALDTETRAVLIERLSAALDADVVISDE